MDTLDYKSFETICYGIFIAFSLAFALFARENKKTIENEVAEYLSGIDAQKSNLVLKDLAQNVSYQEKSKYVMIIIQLFFILQFIIFGLTFAHDMFGLLKSNCTEQLLFTHILFLFTFSFLAFLMELLNWRKSSKARVWFD